METSWGSGGPVRAQGDQLVFMEDSCDSWRAVEAYGEQFGLTRTVEAHGGQLGLLENSHGEQLGLMLDRWCSWRTVGAVLMENSWDPVRYHSGGSMKLNACISLLAHMVYL
jgi:hypothetical protein